MSEVEAFRDRCARAMGFELASGYWNTATRDKKPERWTSGEFEVATYLWLPDEDYNQAVMMRDRCEELGRNEDFVTAVLMHSDGRALSGDPGLWMQCIAFASAKQIAEAALKVLSDAPSDKGGGV